NGEYDSDSKASREHSCTLLFWIRSLIRRRNYPYNNGFLFVFQPQYQRGIEVALHLGGVKNSNQSLGVDRGPSGLRRGFPDSNTGRCGDPGYPGQRLSIRSSQQEMPFRSRLFSIRYREKKRAGSGKNYWYTSERNRYANGSLAACRRNP